MSPRTAARFTCRLLRRGSAGRASPDPVPVETTMLRPGTAVELNPQPLPPGSHTESFRTGRGA